ncbi:hypothetical protein [Halorussus marinus]|uniref:hypothetical protein n=1 Tax=Halorussus marinus TaxID=2505976 RepID=UPI00106DEC60|nr:hypothetical protein [Halorussus marinus]
MNKWEQLEGGASRYDLVKTGAVTSVELEAYRDAESREEFEELVEEGRAVADHAEHEERYRRPKF